MKEVPSMFHLKLVYLRAERQVQVRFDSSPFDFFRVHAVVVPISLHLGKFSTWASYHNVRLFRSQDAADFGPFTGLCQIVGVPGSVRAQVERRASFHSLYSDLFQVLGNAWR